MQKKRQHQEKQLLIQKISDTLGHKTNIMFAYIFGSFSTSDSSRDIDIGIFVSDAAGRSPLHIELEIERELQDIADIPVDVRILNKAPLSFTYHVIRDGKLIVDKKRDLRSDFEGLICRKYFDFCHLRNEYLREVVNAPL